MMGVTGKAKVGVNTRGYFTKSLQKVYKKFTKSLQKVYNPISSFLKNHQLTNFIRKTTSKFKLCSTEGGFKSNLRGLVSFPSSAHRVLGCICAGRE
jgi:hypothetical protein